MTEPAGRDERRRLLSEEFERLRGVGAMLNAWDWFVAGSLALPTEGTEGAKLADMEQRKDAAYLERNQVVAALAKAFPSGIARTAIEGWSEDWHGCVYIDLPTGQASWHFHDSQAYLFDGLPPYAGQWDGHTTEQKYERLAALVPAEGAKLAGQDEWQAVAEADLSEIERRLCAPNFKPFFLPVDAAYLANVTMHMVREVRAARALAATQAKPEPAQAPITNPKQGA